MKHKIFTISMVITLIFTMSSVAFASEETETTPAAVQTTAQTTEKTTVKTVSPKSVKAYSTKTATIVVKWSKVSGAKSYSLYRATKKSGKYKRIKTTKARSYTDKKVTPTKKYYYKVRANMPSGTKDVKSVYSKTVGAKLKIKKSFKVKAYSYSGGGYTRIGKKAKVGRIAVDPKVIKLGTWLYVEGYGVCQACDTGGNIKGKVIDVYHNTSSQSSKWGVKYPKVYVIK